MFTHYAFGCKTSSLPNSSCADCNFSIQSSILLTVHIPLQLEWPFQKPLKILVAIVILVNIFWYGLFFKWKTSYLEWTVRNQPSSGTSLETREDVPHIEAAGMPTVVLNTWGPKTSNDYKRYWMIWKIVLPFFQ